MLEEEEFEAWLVHPATVALMEKCERISRAAKKRWFDISWNRATEDDSPLQTLKLAYLRGKSDAFTSVARIEYKNLFKEDKEDE